MLTRRLKATGRFAIRARPASEELFDAEIVRKAAHARRFQHERKQPGPVASKLRLGHMQETENAPHVLIGPRVDVVLEAVRDWIFPRAQHALGAALQFL